MLFRLSFECMKPEVESSGLIHGFHQIYMIHVYLGWFLVFYSDYYLCCSIIPNENRFNVYREKLDSADEGWVISDGPDSIGNYFLLFSFSLGHLGTFSMYLILELNLLIKFSL